MWIKKETVIYSDEDIGFRTGFGTIYFRVFRLFIYSIYIFPHNTDNDKLGFQGLSIQIHDQDLAQ